MPRDYTKQRVKAEAIRLFAFRYAADAEDRGASATGLAAKVAVKFGMSRQAAHRHLKALVDEGALISSGANRGRSYGLAELDSKLVSLPLKGDLEENAVWRTHVAGLMEAVPASVVDLAHFCFTEMVNNAIDHSNGNILTIKVVRTPLYVRMTVGDDGIGIFKKIREALNLDDERHAMLELTKGKFTTAPKAHSGLGIFFSCRSCDKFSIISGLLYFGHSRIGPDWLMDDLDDRDFRGTHVVMTIDLDSNKRLNAVFNEYATPDNPGFSRTIIPVKVAQYGDENLISRSQAKRVLARVEKFREVLFDFEGVEIVGQGFADEIFRVFAQEHPEVRLLSTRASPQIQGMIDLAVQSRDPS